MVFMWKDMKKIMKNSFFLQNLLDMANKYTKNPSLESGLYYAYIKPIKHVAYKVNFQNINAFKTWHDRLGRPSIGMMRKIITSSIGYDLTVAKFPQTKDYVCTTCATRKLILRPSHLKIPAEPLRFLEHILRRHLWSYNTNFWTFQVFYGFDWCIYKMVTYVFSTQNHTFAKIMLQIIKLKEHYPGHRIQSIRMDNAAEFSSHAFNDYCMALGICPHSEWFGWIFN